MSKRGRVRYEKMRLHKGPDTECASCGSKLSKTELGNGVRRCKACRAKDPGRPNSQTVILKPSVPDQHPTSWWLQVPRADWQQAVEGHTFTASRKTLVLNHGGFGDSQL